MEPETPRPSVHADPFGVARVDLEVQIRAAPQRVWSALVDETAAWWNRDFYTAPPDAPGDRPAPRMVIEPRLGGRVYEDWGDGAGAVWYSVTAIDPPRSLQLLGQLSSAFGGPAMTMLQITLRPADGGATRLHLSDTIFGRVADTGGTSTRDGWMALLDQGLRRFVEEGTRA